jgi:hypothetical protein
VVGIAMRRGSWPGIVLPYYTMPHKSCLVDCHSNVPWYAKTENDSSTGSDDHYNKVIRMKGR